MTQVTAQMVKELRDRTGVGMGKCKEALTEASGDIEKAIDNLRKAGAASAVKKGDRETNEGLIGFANRSDAIALVEINAETDFVVKNDRFQAFVKRLAEILHSDSPEAFMKEKFEGQQTVEEARVELVQVLGENIQLRRTHLVIKEKDASYGIYSHMGGQIVVLVVLKGSADFGEVARDIAMHIAAEAPDYLTIDEIPADVIAREKDIALSQIKNKPPEIQDKIMEGKIRAFSEQVCLIGQKFVKDPSTTVSKYVEKQGKEKGCSLSIASFARWQVGGA